MPPITPDIFAHDCDRAACPDAVPLGGSDAGGSNMPNGERVGVASSMTATCAGLNCVCIRNMSVSSPTVASEPATDTRSLALLPIVPGAGLPTAAATESGYPPGTEPSWSTGAASADADASARIANVPYRWYAPWRQSGEPASAQSCRIPISSPRASTFRNTASRARTCASVGVAFSSCSDLSIIVNTRFVRSSGLCAISACTC